MAYILSETGVSSFAIDINRDLSDNKIFFIQFYDTMGGRTGEYKYGEILNFKFTVEYLTSSQGQQINKWWRDGTDIVFKTENNSSYTSRIHNDTQPVKMPTFPYYDELNAEIELMRSA